MFVGQLYIFLRSEFASKEEILKRHRKMMQLNHPDAGGTQYLASKINEAKDELLNQNSEF